ncbi:uncharacterized protein LOC111397963 [Olea europaea var. sylvestris]|uniref:uncharacterized protein LOC111397963 n=1 Tax=Olea europaea var. sylvestris TaxID=158386 RepID=UPI000C1D011C|nr:uncharacterized protein LOC111397963 [Olea europaea var. sylvestris]
MDRHEDCEEDPDFIDSDRDFESEQDDIEYDRNFPEFNFDQDMRNPQFEVGQILSSTAEFREAVRMYDALNGSNVKFKANDERRVQGICKLGCQWRIWASRMDASERMQVKSYTSEHTCSRDQFNRHLKKDLHTDISRNVAWKMRRYAKEILVGSLHEQFRRSYAAEVLRTNVGSMIIIALQEQIFKEIYVCLNYCKAGFRDGCRMVVGVNGCHLRGSFRGIMLIAVGIDTNDCIYPVAYVVVEKENTASWRWFLTSLSEDISIGNGMG